MTSIANSLKLDDDDDDDFDPKSTTTATATAATTTTTSGENPPSRSQNPNYDVDDEQIPSQAIDSSSSTPPRGVKEDLSEISKTLTRQFWGVASFLAPPPPEATDRGREVGDSDQDLADPAGITGIRNDLSEIGGRFRTGITKLSSNKAVSEFTKIASNILQFGSEEDLTVEEYAQRGVVGVTEEVVMFARDVALHPETWLDFPLPDDDDEQDFDLSDAQQEHALAVERLAPELAALRTELCLGYMSDACFWKIYFVLVHPRLSRHDAEILSTPEIVRAREMLAHELHDPSKPKSYESGPGNTGADTTKLSHEEQLSVPVNDLSESIPVEISAVEPASSAEADIEMDKHAVTSSEIPVVDKKVVEEVSVKPSRSEKPTPSTSISVVDSDDNDADDWLKEENTEADTIPFKGTSYPMGNDDEDISFSDLEEDDDVPTSSKKPGHPNDKVSSETRKNKESNDWLDVEDIDIA